MCYFVAVMFIICKYNLNLIRLFFGVEKGEEVEVFSSHGSQELFSVISSVGQESCVCCDFGHIQLHL